MDTQEGQTPVEPVQASAQQAVRQETAPRRVRRTRMVFFQLYLLVALGGFALLAFLASNTPYLPEDLVITRSIQLIHFTGLQGLMVFISWWGFMPQNAVLVLLLSLVVYLLGLRWESVLLLLLAAVDGALNSVIKVVVARPRPGADLVHVFANLPSYSFPSGHVMFYTAYFGFLFFLVYSLLKRSWKRALLLIVTGGMVLLVGFSRIYEGEHWASDVIAGYILGSLVLSAGILVYRWGKPKFFPRQPVAPEPPEAASTAH
ncbi:MAG TPA: phosphatase PAP2 family protein [Anaerolineaceae bacterium]